MVYLACQTTYKAMSGQSVGEMMSYPVSPHNLSPSAAWSSAAHLTVYQTWQTNQVAWLQSVAVEMMSYPVLAGNLSPLVVAWSASWLPELIWWLWDSSWVWIWIWICPPTFFSWPDFHR